ncbi:beta-mannosidase [Algisphaera agarilytica]|uniref:Beta-mannosidase B n=1 Tax=Algisphaera agarilytica TaxID=1385975 RepID=A0A7X0H4G5_9BACT|nr:glycoside hydrolase family 2 protein [Algisphaera agarilytica]MBB6429128.1 beta-mannosidase [Algisphaera agarilytica]
MTANLTSHADTAQVLDLGGTWSLRSKDGQYDLPGQVPGCVHADLLAAGLVPDPYYRMNEHQVQWVGKTDWVYERVFDVSKDWLSYNCVALDCEGLDTLARVVVNGEECGAANNMFRRWRFDVRQALVAGENSIQVFFESSVNYSLEKIKQAPIPHVFWDLPDAKGRAWIRKQQSQFGWDWGPMIVTSGIHAPIRLVALDTPRLERVGVRQQHSQKGVVVRVEAPLSQFEGYSALRSKIKITRLGMEVASCDVESKDGVLDAELLIEQPELWWPAGMGEQPLYDVEIELRDELGGVFDVARRHIGLREFKLVREADEWGESFAFEANGRRFFAKGANWIPADVIPSRIPKGRIRSLLGDAVDANMNMIRVWGGGVYESEEFYDICDELGLCVWQDFMFACAPYPTTDPSFIENVRQEAIQATQRLNHRASICLWCGNNELEWLNMADTPGNGKMSWEQYLPFFDFDGMLGTVVKENAPDTTYWPCSPLKTIGDRIDVMDERSGDNHVWGVWHSGEDIDWYRETAPRFASEFGFQGFPEPKTMAAVIDHSLGDGNLCSQVVDHRQRAGAGTGRIMYDLARWFKLPHDFEHTLWLTQILQSHCVQTAVEHWRRCAPRTMGALYWQLNDVWPGPSWSSIDYYGRWKGLHYVMRRSFAPRLLSVVSAKDGVVEVHLTHEESRWVKGRLTWTLTALTGEAIKSGEAEITAKPMMGRPVYWIDLADQLAEYGKSSVALWLEFEPEDAQDVLSANLFFERPKHMGLSNPELAVVGCEANKSGFDVTIKAERCAAWVWLTHPEVDLRCSDNFFHLRGGQPKTVHVKVNQPLDHEQFIQKLEVKHLLNTYAN